MRNEPLSKRASSDFTDAPRGLLDLCRELLQHLGPLDATPANTSTPIIRLRLDELVADADNDILIDDDSARFVIEIHADSPIEANGVLSERRAPTADELAGYRFIRFANGRRLLYAPEVEVVVTY